MTDVFDQVVAIENEVLSLLDADELDTERLPAVLDRRQALHTRLTDAVDADPELASRARPLLQQAYDNNKALQQRSEHERDDVKSKLLTLNQSRKARKAY